MSRRGTWFWIVVLFVSALALVDIRNRYLLLFAPEQRLMTQKDALQVEWGRLLLEQGTLAEHRRVDRIARRNFDMVMPNPRRIVLLYMRPTPIP
ncbi:MAG TPA: cell division protein FtsL [Acidiferrobacter sp.]|nr:cell division protein FtsL [Acidiferrobacter sp.]